MNRVKRLIEITPSQLKLYEAIGRDFPDLSPAQTARIVAIVREWVHDEVNTGRLSLFPAISSPKRCGRTLHVERGIQRAGCLPWLPYEVFLALSNGCREIKLNNKTRTTQKRRGARRGLGQEY